VRGSIEELRERYPTESLPELERERMLREEQRLEQLRPQSSGTTGDYRIHAAVLREADAAAALLERLIALGFDGTVVSRREHGDAMHSVEIGPYADVASAREVARRIQSEAGLDAFVVIEP